MFLSFKGGVSQDSRWLEVLDSSIRFIILEAIPEFIGRLSERSFNVYKFINRSSVADEFRELSFDLEFFGIEYREIKKISFVECRVKVSVSDSDSLIYINNARVCIDLHHRIVTDLHMSPVDV